MLSEAVIKEYRQLKEKYPAGVILLQVGIFYKICLAGAQRWAGELGLKLITISEPDSTGGATERSPVRANENISFCGFPTSGLDKYVGRLIRLGCEKVIICNQMKNNEGVNKRVVSQIITGRLAGQSQSPDV